MSIELRPGPARRPGVRERFSRHAWIVILLLVAASILALCGRSASAHVNHVEEIIAPAGSYADFGAGQPTGMR